MLAELLLGRAEEPFPYRFYFVDGSPGYRNGIFRLHHAVHNKSKKTIKPVLAVWAKPVLAVWAKHQS